MTQNQRRDIISVISEIEWRTDEAQSAKSMALRMIKRSGIWSAQGQAGSRGIPVYISPLNEFTDNDCHSVRH